MNEINKNKTKDNITRLKKKKTNLAPVFGQKKKKKKLPSNTLSRQYNSPKDKNRQIFRNTVAIGQILHAT